MKFFIAIDDTDNLQSRGTGYLARSLATGLLSSGLAETEGIIRHQLFVNEAIPYTSHNSAACLMAEGEELEKIIYFCRTFVRSGSAEGSDPGLCIAAVDLVDQELIEWGRSAKQVVIKMDDAIHLARQKGIFLEGLGGTNGGVIGALAAVALSKSGNDGRFLWVKGMRKYMGVMSREEIGEETSVDEVRCGEQLITSLGARIYLPEWWRPVWINGKKVVLVESEESNLYEYKFISKDRLRQISS